MPTKYSFKDPDDPAPEESVSFLDKLKQDITEPSLDENPLWARIKGFGAGAITGAQNIGTGLKEAVKHPMTAAPALTRAGSGFASFMGGVPGAAISGAGELGAEALEGSLFEQSPWRSAAKVGTAAGIGAIPMASTLKAGRVIPSIARSAAYSGGGEAARELAAGEDFDPTRIGTSTAIGGATGGVLAKLLGLGGAAAKVPAVKPPIYEVQPTSQTGLGTSVRPIKPIQGIETSKTPFEQYAPAAQARAAAAREAKLPEPSQEPAGPIPARYPTPYGGGGGISANEVATRSENELASSKAQAAAEKMLAGEVKTEEKAARAATEASRIAEARAAAEEEGLIPKTSYGESVSAPLEEGGTGRVSTRYVEPPATQEGDPLLEAGVTKRRGSVIRREGGEMTAPKMTPEEGVFKLWKNAGADDATASAQAQKLQPPSTYDKQQLAKVAGAAPAAEPVAPTTLAEILKVPEPAAPAAAPFAFSKKPNPGESLDQFARRVGMSRKQAAQHYEAVPAEPVAVAPEVEAQNQDITKRLRETLDSVKANPVTAIEEVPITTSPAAEVPAAIPAEPGSIAEFLGLHTAPPGEKIGGNTGAAYRKIQAMAKAGEATPEQVAAAREAHLRNIKPELFENQPAAAPPLFNKSGTGSVRGGKSLDELSQMLKTQPAAEPQAPPVSEAGYAQDLADLESLPPATRAAAIKRMIESEKGEIDPALMAKLGAGGLGALIGAPVGAAAGDDENRGRNALLGALGGAAAGYGGAAGAQALSRGVEGGLTDAALKFIPKWQRSSLLTRDPNSLLANVAAGPWGSGVVMGLEKGLGGTASERPQGRDLLKQLFNVKQLAEDFGGSLDEASKLIGRAEGEGLGANPSIGEKSLAFPGTAMTAGDMATKAAIERAGFSPEQARRATLTSEPEFKGVKQIADFGKGTPKNPKDPSKFLTEMAFPFKRTPANIFEQGMMRMPGVGSWVQSRREIPDPIREQIVQQLMNAGIGATGYGLGENLDPETAKIVRKYGSNLAGPHSMMFSGGFAAGQAKRAGRDVLGPKTLQQFSEALPLPTAQAFQDWLKMAAGAAQGELNVPKGMIPLQNWPNVIKKALTPGEPAVPAGKYTIRDPGE